MGAHPVLAAENGGFFSALFLPIDLDRPHRIGLVASWHGRLMVLSWCILFPVGILVARFWKVTPRQNWPAKTDNPTWWRTHLFTQYSGAGFAVIGFFLATRISWSGLVSGQWHAVLGWLVGAMLVVQIGGGLLRGTKGGPTAPASDGSLFGDHYNMTRRRRVFEYLHKSLGYLAVCIAAVAAFLGLWTVNAPLWMWLAIGLWWVLIICLFVGLQSKGGAIDTYQAIWGPGQEHPGNRIKPIGLGVKRMKPRHD